MRTPRFLTLALLGAALMALVSFAAGANLNYVVAYGDSLPGNGNLYGAIGYPPRHPIGMAVPGMLTQVAMTKTQIAPIAGSSLFVAWGGANDFLTNGFTPATAQVAVSNLVSMVTQLQGAGARHIIVPGMPDIGLTPDYLGNASATALSSYFNQLLLAELPKNVTYLDTFGLTHEVVDNPSAYGLTDVTDPCFDGVTLCANPGRYLFWDGFHPTTRGHEIIATAIEQAAVPEPSSLLILGSGILGVAGVLRRKQRPVSRRD